MKWPNWTEDTSYCSPAAYPGWRLRTGRIVVGAILVLLWAAIYLGIPIGFWWWLHPMS